jgi:hypothetical protein
MAQTLPTAFRAENSTGLGVRPIRRRQLNRAIDRQDIALNTLKPEPHGPFLIDGHTRGFALNPLFAASVIFRG